MKKVKRIHQAVSAPIDNLLTYRAMPTPTIDNLDPFLFINHHGPQVFPANNKGLPFGPHPHRGFETLTYIFKGDIVHWDSNGHKSRIGAGGAQWMTAGSGLIHSEVSSEQFKAKGGEEEIIQLWLNLSSKNKMIPPNYHGLKEEDITHFHLDDEKVKVNLISGTWGPHQGPHPSLENLTMSSVEIREGGTIDLNIPSGHQVLFYMVRGKLEVSSSIVETYQLVEFMEGENSIPIKGLEDSLIIFGHGKPLKEPIAAHGPFVMNTRQELIQAFEDYQSGKMGSWDNNS